LQKITGIILLILVAAGCSVLRNNEKTVEGRAELLNSGNTVENTETQNISNSGFFIQKAEIEVINSEGSNKFVANIKFVKPDKYLISLRSRTGIEGARIFISGDSIQMNDRINKKLYSGTSGYLSRKYGFSQSFLPIIFGDLILEKRCLNGNERCERDKLVLACQSKGVSLNYGIDCKKQKVISVDQINSFNQQGLNIRYNKFFKISGILIPKIIEFNDRQYNIEIKIKVLKVQLPWTGNINFIPGRGYELIELL
jgi:hypothetical protein